MIGYTIIIDQDVIKLAKRVEILLNDNWKCQGGIISVLEGITTHNIFTGNRMTFYYFYAQAMTKEQG